MLRDQQLWLHDISRALCGGSLFPTLLAHFAKKPLNYFLTKPPIDPEYDAIIARLRDIYKYLAQPKGLTIRAAIEPPGRKKRKPEIEDQLLPLTRKELGELAELAFMHIGRRKGIPSAKPYGESLPFDQIAIAVGRRYALSKVQVRCTAHHQNFIYTASLRHGAGTKPYQPGDSTISLSLFSSTKTIPAKNCGCRAGSGAKAYFRATGCTAI